MRHYVAVQDANGRWFYANEGRHRQTGEYGWIACGACTQRPTKECPKCLGKRFTENMDCDCMYGRVEDPDTPPCPGHATAAEAYEHQKQRILDMNLEFYAHRDDADTLHRCEAPSCGKHTSGFASAGSYRHWTLCDEHQTREIVEPLMHVGESWES